MKLNIFPTKQKLKVLLVPLLAALILLPAFIGLFPSATTYALPSNTSSINAKLEGEYKAWASYNAVSFCLSYLEGKDRDIAKDFSKAEIAFAEAKDGISTPDLYVGNIVNPSGGVMTCNNNTEMKTLLTNIGFESVKEFSDNFWPINSGCKGNSCPPISLSKMREIIRERIRTKDLAGPEGDNAVNSLSKAAKYWFWKTQYEVACGAKGYENEKETLGTPIERRNESTNSDEQINNAWFVLFADLSKVHQLKYFTYKTEDDNGVEELGYRFDQPGSSDANPDKPGQDEDMQALNCIEITRRHVKDEAEAYRLLVYTEVDTCVKAGGTQSECTDKTNTNSSLEDNKSSNLKAECLKKDALSYVLCPLIDGFVSVVEAVDTQINDMLNIDSDRYFGEGSKEAGNFKTVWESTRTISVGFLIIMALVMIISTAIGSGPFDAYTVKKIMPRILIVVVLISVSWPLVRFMVEMSNTLGFAVRGLIQGPFLKAGGVDFDYSIVSIGVASLVAGGFALGLIGLLSFAVTAFLAVMVAFLTLILRQILVILLAIVAPIALVSYILPNTQKFGKFWWEAFSKALLVFPIISGFIAVGRIFAVVSRQADDDVVHQLISFVAYFSPYFLIPTAFKMAGGLLGNLSGMVNDRSRGAFDRLKNFRKGQTKSNFEKTMSGNRFNPEGRLNRFNKVSQFGAMAATGKGGLNATKWNERIGMQAALGETTEGDHLLAENAIVKAAAPDDAIMDAAVKAHGREAIMKNLKDHASGRYAEATSDELNRAAALVEAVQKQGTRGAIKYAAAIAHAASGTGGDSVELLEEAYNASEGNQFILNRVIAAQKGAAERAQRFEHSAIGHTDLESSARQIGAIRRDANLSDEEKASQIEGIKGDLYDKAIKAGGTQRLAQTKPAYFGDVIDNLAERFNIEAEAARGGDAAAGERAIELGAQLKSFRDSMNGAPEENKQQIISALDKAGIRIDKSNDATGGSYSVDEQIGYILNGISMDLPSSVISANTSEQTQRVTNRVKSTAGGYDAGGSSLTPAQIEEMRRRGGGNDPGKT